MALGEQERLHWTSEDEKSRQGVVGALGAGARSLFLRAVLLGSWVAKQIPQVPNSAPQFPHK